MKRNRSFLITILTVVLAMCSGILLNGCASTGGGTDAELEMQSPGTTGAGTDAGLKTETPRTAGGPEASGLEAQASPRIDTVTSVLKDTSAGSSAVRKQPVVHAGGSGVSGQEPQAQSAGLKADENRLEHLAMFFQQRLERILPKALQDADWNQIASVLGGLVVVSLIWALAFWLARLPRRRRRVGRYEGGRPIGEHVGVSVPL